MSVLTEIMWTICTEYPDLLNKIIPHIVRMITALVCCYVFNFMLLSCLELLC